MPIRFESVYRSIIGSVVKRESHFYSWRHRVFPHGDAHILCNGSPPCIVDYGKHLKELFSQGVVLARYGGGGETTVFHCGYLVCDLELCKTFLGGLPPVFRVNIRNDPAGQWLENSIKFSAAEASANGRAAMRYWRGCLKRSLWKLSAVTWRTCRRSKQAGLQAREILRWERPWRICIALRNAPGQLPVSPSRWGCRDRCWSSGSGSTWANLR